MARSCINVIHDLQDVKYEQETTHDPGRRLTIATALKIAERRPIAKGWKFTSSEIGIEARKIIEGLLLEPKDTQS